MRRGILNHARGEKLDSTLALIQEKLGDVYTAASLEVRSHGEVVCRAAFGTHAPGATRVKINSLFDLASLTKLFVGTALLALFDRRAFALDDPVVSVMPEFGGLDARRADVTFRHLLSHTSGLPAHVSFRDEATYEAVLDRVCSIPLANAPGREVVYSDLGFMLAGEAVARFSGLSLASAIQSYVTQPLDLHSVRYRPPPEMRHSIVATEHDARRGGLLRGDVHDENCWAMGGVAGHAGLFGSAHDAASFAEMFRLGGLIEGRRVLTRPTALSAVREQARSADERRGFAWALKATDAHSCGRLFSYESFGHTGYTGTSVWVDPDRGLTVALLTNRVQRSRDPEPIRALRAAVHDSIVDELDASPLGD
ncbi:MAG: beta-lactamase family protein [Candidatus Eremiobacteraeota bacterium]|nr:beta-lactamase family protein [Candidatus Eremiobacteraeota bacterium]MBC5827533.1 beta-lactamase family protein [Candidatus Eremiobacteraeota bacterium]